MSTCEQFVCPFRIRGKAVGLSYRSFVPVHPKPTQVFEDRRFEGDVRSFYIGVLDPEEKGAFIGPSEQQIDYGGAGIPYMEITRWARRKSDLWHIFVLSFQETNGVGRNAFPPSCEAETFRGLCLDAHPIAANRCDRCNARDDRIPER